jgi:outer membrane receptor protein involved in Fe transport
LEPLAPPISPQRPSRERATLCLLALLFATGFIVRGHAAETRRKFDVPAGEAIDTLKRVAQQGGVEILFLAETVRGVRTPPVHGEFTAGEALERLVYNTGLVIGRHPQTGTLTVSRATPQRPEPPRRSDSTRTTTLKTPFALLSAWLAAFAATGYATESAPAAAVPDEAVTLSPFQVSSTRDTGYTATNTLSGGRISTPLQELASSVTVLTRELLDDIAATDLLGAANYFTNAVPGTPAGMSDYSVSIRGFPSGFLYRNFFISYVNPDSYVTERLDSARGPNALVFGDTKAGGALNMSTKQAKFYNFAQVAYRYNSFGGRGRTALDANFKLNDKLAFRVGGVHQDENDWADFTYTRRQGLFATTTWRPLPKTTIRLEGERYRQHSSSVYFGSVLRDNMGTWDGTTSYSAANQPLVAGSGTSRLSGAYRVFAPGTSLGIVDWNGFAQTSGTGYQLDEHRPAYLPASVPLLPYRGYNIRLGDGNDVALHYQTIAGFIEQQVGERLFLELAGNIAQQQRRQVQQATEGVFVDVNSTLPNGAPNPFFKQRYTESAQLTFPSQRNRIYEARATAAYVTNLGSWSEHRLLLGAGYRRDQYRDFTQQVVLDVPGARFQNPFLNPNALRLRIYESERGTDATLPAGVKTGRWSSFPGEDKDLYSGQVAASSRWFRDGRLVTLIGIRRDQLRKYGTVARVDPATGEYYDYLERYDGPAAPGLSGAGSFQKFKPVITRTAGAVYKLTRWLSPYANYSEGYDTSTVGLLLDPATGLANVPLPAKESKGYELGLKFTFLENRLSGSVVYYDNQQTNDPSTGVSFPRTEINAIWNVVDDVPTSPRQLPSTPSEIVDYKGHGLEFEATANLTRSWRIFFNLAFPETERQGGFARTLEYYQRNHAEWQRTLDRLVATGDARATAFRNNLQTVDARLNAVANGLPLPGTLDYSANLFTNYEFKDGALRGFRLGGGANVRGQRYVIYQQRVASDPNSFEKLKVRGYELFSLTAGYRTKVFNHAVNFQVNVDNLFDEQFKRYTTFNTIVTPAGSTVLNGNNYSLQAPRRVLFTTDIRF